MSTDPSDALQTVVVIGLVVAAALLILGLVLANQRNQRLDAVDAHPELRPVDNATGPLAAVIVNPTKFLDGGASVRRLVDSMGRERGWRPPLWLTTTADEPGATQARLALAAGADTVIVCGGDGTVRQVAEILVGTGVPLGLLPAGTGNLLARNVGIDVQDFARAIETALVGTDRPVDVGYISFDDGPEQIFLVMAGMGFDADMMLSAPEGLKAKVGPAAYVVSGARHLLGDRIRVGVSVDGGPESRRQVRAVIVGNCGKLMGGVVLMPDARLDDGQLDAVAIAPKGLMGWGDVGAAILTRDRKGHRTFERYRGRAIDATAAEPLPVEIDGDPVGYATSMRTRVMPGVLTVRGEAGATPLRLDFRGPWTRWVPSLPGGSDLGDDESDPVRQPDAS